MQATYTTTVNQTAAGFVATATFPSGLFTGRRPVSGNAAPTIKAAIASLLAQPKLLVVLTSIATPIDWGNVDA
jgi:hypothetical protein